MNDKLQRIFGNLIPFLMLGVAIALLVGLFIMFSYVLFWGLIIGAILWALASIKAYLFSAHQKKDRPLKTKGRIIDIKYDNKK